MKHGKGPEEIPSVIPSFRVFVIAFEWSSRLLKDVMDRVSGLEITLEGLGGHL